MLFCKICAYLSNESEKENVGKERRISKKSSCREIQIRIEKFNKYLDGRAYYLISDINEIKMTGAVISESRELAEKYLPEFIKTADIRSDDIELCEVTFKELEDLLSVAEDNCFIDDGDDIMEKFNIRNIYRETRHMLFDVGENLIEDMSRRTIYGKIEKTLYARTLVPEIDRIFAGPENKRFRGHPCHYIMMTDDENDARKDTYRALLSALYANRRLYLRRYFFIDLDPTVKVSRSSFESVFFMSKGGCVVMRYRPTDESEEGGRASANREIVEMVGEIVKKYRNETLAIVCIPRNCTKTRLMFYEYMCSVNIVEFGEENARGETAERYLKNLCAENGVRGNKGLFARIEKGKGYSSCELKRIFDEWYNIKLKSEIFLQYKNISSDEIKNHMEDEICSADKQLAELIGLSEAKQVIKRSKDYFMAQRIFSDKGFLVDRPAMSMVFTGSPGTCKTTVARLVSEIFCDAGILSEGKLVECGRGDLVGRYVGWTAQQVQKKFREAKGSVLFIDEAYSLVDAHSGSFGDEAINTIVQEMENHRDDVLVIFAGYSDKMEAFLNKNPGLRSRIAFHVHFDDYTPDELCEISRLIASKKGLNISAEAMKKLRVIYEIISKQSDFGNGRAARNIIESAKMSMASRLLAGNIENLTSKEITTIIPEDIPEPVLPARTKRVVGF